jgi:hypothetical protein
MIVALVPIIGMETLLIRKRLPYKPWPILRATAVANLVSTIVGIPLTWLVLAPCQMVIGLAVYRIPAMQNWDGPMARVISVVLSAAWLPPFQIEASPWIVPLAALVLLVPFFFVSVWSERLVMERMLPVAATEVALEGEVSDSRLRRAVRDANLLSYGFLFILTCGWLTWYLLHK